MREGEEAERSVRAACRAGASPGGTACGGRGCGFLGSTVCLHQGLQSIKNNHRQPGGRGHAQTWTTKRALRSEG